MLLTLSLISCSSVNNPGNGNYFSKVKLPEIIKSNEDTNQTPFIIDMADNSSRAAFSINIKNPEFTTKANESGQFQKTVANIDHYLIYLVKNANPDYFPFSSDPLANIVGGPFTIPNGGAASRTVTFTNVGSSGTDTYYVAVRAQDSANADLIEPGNGYGPIWNSTVQRFAVTSTGVKVDAAYQINTTNNLSVSIQLSNYTGATVQGGITLNPGNDVIPAYAVSLKSPTGALVTVAGTGIAGNTASTNPLLADLNNPKGVAVDSAGNIYIADSTHNVIRKINTSNVLSTFAGVFNSTGVNETTNATTCRLNAPQGVAVDSSGNVYIADTGNHRVRKVNGTTISNVVGTGAAGNASTSGSIAVGSTNAMLSSPQGVAVDSAGNVYIANTGNHTIRKVTAGNMTNVAGTGTAGDTASTNPTVTQLNAPGGVAVDSSGNIYIADSTHNVIRKINTSNVLSTFAGVFNSTGVNETTNATTCRLNAPQGVAADSSGNIYIADTGNHRIRKVTGTTIAGIAGTGSSGNEPVRENYATSSPLNSPNAVAVDTTGNVFIANTVNHTVRKVIK